MSEKTYLVKLIFGPTLQGEATYSGTPVLFLRFSGCNMWSGKPDSKPQSICRFCDTDFYGGERKTAQQIHDELRALDPNAWRVVVSGGEPALQFDAALGKFLTEKGWELHIETNGSKEIDGIEYFKHVTVSPKVPASLIKTQHIDDLKILYPPISPSITPEDMFAVKAEHKWLQPVWDENYSANLKATIDYCLKNPLWRLSMQTHKYAEVS